jgi:hypothetical protein
MSDGEQKAFEIPSENRKLQKPLIIEMGSLQQLSMRCVGQVLAFIIISRYSIN